MNLTPRWVNYLSDAGYETIHWSSIGPATAKDREICDHARDHGYVVLTNDLDFPQILAHTKEAAPSVILLRGEPLVPELRGDALLRVLQECHSELAQGRLFRLIGRIGRAPECCRSDRSPQSQLAPRWGSSPLGVRYC